MVRRRQKVEIREVPEPVTWRDGTHISGTPIWCDARRARDVCFVSCAHAVPASRHGQLIATAPTLALLTRSDQHSRAESQLSVPYGHPFTLGTRRLELLQSGHAVGGAAMVADVDGDRVLYAGAVNPHGGGLGGEADVRSCDAVVLSASYGDPAFEFPPVEEAQAKVRTFAHEVVAKGAVAVLLVSSPSKGLDVAAHLANAGLEVRAHRSIHHAAQRLRGLDEASLPPLRRWTSGQVSRTTRRCALLWLARHVGSLGRAALPPHSRLALVSGSAVDSEAVAEVEVDAAFPWSNQASFTELLGYIDACGARRVYLTGRHAEPMAAAIDSAARSARVLGPPRQMSLF